MEHISDLLPEAINSVQVQQESKPLKSGDEQKFEIAVSRIKIKYSSQAAIKEVLRLVMLKVGIRAANLPSDEEKAVLMHHVITEYGNHTPEEIGLAFDMAITGKLDVDATTFENFSCLYFSKIMNAYRLWAAVTYRQTVEKDLPQPEPKFYTEEETRNWQREQAEAAYQRLLKGNMNYLPRTLMIEILNYDVILNGQTLDEYLLRAINSGAKNIYKKD